MAEFIELLSESALADLKKANAELVTMVANVDNVGKKMKNISTPSGSDSAIKSLTEQYKQQEKAIVSLQGKLDKARLEEIKIQKAREVAMDKYEAKLKKQSQAEERAVAKQIAPVTIKSTLPPALGFKLRL